jgi:nucleolar protein 12
MGPPRKRATLAASKDRVDPTLDALFASSSGPVNVPPTSRYKAVLPPKASKASQQGDADRSPSGDDETLSELGSEADSAATAVETDEGSEDDDIAGT